MNKFLGFFKKLSLVAFLLATLASCGGNSDSTKTVDYVNDGSVKLKLDYQNHDFFKDGVGAVTLRTCIDGDTAHFNALNSSSSDYIKSRFYGIDTPESTGKVEPYGKAASNFTKEKLTNAAANGTIVVSSPSDTYSVPQFDSTGTRYLSLIWVNETVKNAPYDSLVLLNLWIVQEGYSFVKNVEEIPAYSDTFYKAEEQAKAQKLNLFSGEEDPLYNYGDYDDVSLLDLKAEAVLSLTEANHVNKYNNAKVRVRGVVAGFANKIIYLQAAFTGDDGVTQYAGVNIFVGMASILSKFTTVNTYLQLCGTCEDTENFGFQITGVYSWRYTPKDENDTVVLYTPENIPEEYKVHDFALDSTSIVPTNFDYLFSPVYVNDNLVVTGGYTSDGAVALYVTSEDGTKLKFSIYISFTYKPDANKPNLIWNSHETFIGHKFKVSGIYTFHKGVNSTSYQINPRSAEDLVCLDL